MHGEAEAVDFVFTEVGHPDVVQVTLVDQVMGGNGVTEKDISLVERDSVDRILVGREG
ncbi:hypothetical protein D3C85_1528760 [compost metagenome]